MPTNNFIIAPTDDEQGHPTPAYRAAAEFTGFVKTKYRLPFNRILPVAFPLTLQPTAPPDYQPRGPIYTILGHRTTNELYLTLWAKTDDLENIIASALRPGKYIQKAFLQMLPPYVSPPTSQQVHDLLEYLFKNPAQLTPIIHD